MTPRVRLLTALVLTFLGGAALFLWRPTSSAVLYSGYSRIDTGSLTMEISVNPPVGLPGTKMQLVAVVTNNSPQPMTPSILLRLPRGIAADIYALPAGATFNLQENRVDWLPVVPANGVQEFTIDMVVQSTDVTDPEQEVVALLRHQGNEREASALLWIGIPPMIGEVQAQGQVSVGQPVRLRANVAGPGPMSTVWNLGDGRRLELVEPEIVYPAAGEHQITIEAANPAGRVTKQFTLTVLPQPVAAFQPDDDAPGINQPVTFKNASGGQPPLRVFWDFGDGSTAIGEQQPVHTYRQGGTYRVHLTVENDHGQSEAVWDVTVGDAPTADLLIPDTAIVGQPITGQAVGDESIIHFDWDMGDGRRREGPTISHSYRRPGDYFVSMTADNGFGEVQAGRWIHVNPGMTSFFVPMAAQFGNGDLTASAAETTPAIELDPIVDSLSQVFTLDPLQFSPETSLAEQLLSYLNAARARFELPPLAYNFELSAAAQAHALDKSRFPDNPHAGTDGTTAAERLLRVGYRGGYAGEATAWGFSDPREAVEFWVNSDSHRPLLLNQLGTEIGIGYVEDFATTNVWHWTVEFGISYGAPVPPVLRVLQPAASFGALDTDFTNYSWMWPQPLSAGERFIVYLVDGDELIPLGSITQPTYGSRYVLSIDARTALGNSVLASQYQWLVRLEDGLGGVLAEGEQRPIVFTADPAVVLATPLPTVAIITATPVASTPTATPTNIPVDEPPSNEPPPILITATPAPSPTPEPEITP